jgi:ComF family protein
MTSIVSPLCRRCGLPFTSRAGEDHTCSECLIENRYFRKARAFGVYQGTLMEAIHRLKYGGKTSLSKPLSTLAKDTFYRFWDASSIDLLLPVPLHIRRLRERGFNQAHLVNRKWARQEGIPFDGLTLSRRRWTEPQTSLTRAERRKNVKGAFYLRRRDKVKGLRILLVDDVFTTGATVNECAKVLMKAGAGSVDVLTLARAI